MLKKAKRLLSDVNIAFCALLNNLDVSQRRYGEYITSTIVNPMMMRQSTGLNDSASRLTYSQFRLTKTGFDSMQSLNMLSI